MIHYSTNMGVTTACGNGVSPLQASAVWAAVICTSCRVRKPQGLWCITVCNDGMTYGASMPGPHCPAPKDCIARGGCFWRRFHRMPEV